MENIIIERIKTIIAFKKISARAFANAIGFNYTTLNSYLTGRRTNIDSGLMTKIASTFDDISARWLLTGDGKMLKSVNPLSNSSATVHGDVSGSVVGNGVLHNGNVNGDGNIVGIVPSDVERQLIRAKAEIDILKKRIREIEALHKKEKEALNKMLNQAIADKEKAIIDKDRALSMLEKALSK